MLGIRGAVITAEVSDIIQIILKPSRGGAQHGSCAFFFEASETRL